MNSRPIRSDLLWGNAMKNGDRFRRLNRCLMTASIAIAALIPMTSAQALKINLFNTGGVEQGTDAYTGFAAAAWYWESVFTDDVVMNIDVGFYSAGFAPTTLGDAYSNWGYATAGAWRGAVAADASTPLDAITANHLPAFDAPYVKLNTALQKALGLYSGSETDSDAMIRFNSARPFDFDTRDGFATISSDFLAVAIHEIGHALGFTSDVWPGGSNLDIPANTDMFRYKDGAWDLSWGGDPYFSIDGGATQMFGRSGFSSGADGFQTSHWKDGRRIHDGVSCTVLLEPQIGILDPTGGLCQEGIVTAQDLALFDAIGWNLNFDILSNPGYAMKTSDIMRNYLVATGAVPEPATWGMMILGFAMAGAGLRARRKVSVRFA